MLVPRLKRPPRWRACAFVIATSGVVSSDPTASEAASSLPPLAPGPAIPPAVSEPDLPLKIENPWKETPAATTPAPASNAANVSDAPGPSKGDEGTVGKEGRPRPPKPVTDGAGDRPAQESTPSVVPRETPPTEVDDAATEGAEEDDGCVMNVGDDDDKTDSFSYHKRIFPWGMADTVGFIFASFGLMLAAGGGIGGGGILVPLFMLILSFKPKHAIPLSNLTILGGAIANSYFNVQKRHPSLMRPLIDWDMILMMEPSTIAGAVLGSFLSKLLPSIIITSMLAVVLAFMGRRTLTKGLKMWKEEQSKMQLLGGASYDTSLEQLNGGLDPEGREEQRIEMNPMGAPADVAAGATPQEGFVAMSDSEVGDGYLRQLEFFPIEQRNTPWSKVGYLSLCFAGCIVLTILKGSGHIDPLGLSCGSKAFWAISVAPIPWVLIFMWWFRRLLVRTHERREASGYTYGANEIRWDRKNTIRYPAVCTIAGIFAGLFGVGGGIVKGPLMLEMGVEPTVAAATAATMILFTTSAATVSFAVFGLLEHEYGLALFVLGIVCTVIGQLGLNAFMGRQERQSPVVLSIGSVICISSVLVFIDTVYLNWGHSVGELFAVTSICSTHDQ